MSQINNSIKYAISKCDMRDMISETIRFMSHLMILHLLNYSITPDVELFGIDILKTMLFTVLAIVIYNISIKKIWAPNLEKMNKICENTQKPKNRYI